MSQSTASIAETLPARMCMSAVAGMGAACFCHPFDVLRVQLQTAKKSPSGVKPGMGTVISNVYHRDGVKGFYNGLSAAFLRQWMYGSGRMGIYSFLLQEYKRRYPDNKNPSMLAKMAMGACSGGVGSLIGTPSEVALVRMTADSQLPASEKRNYKGIFDCITRIAKSEGFGTNGLYKGANVTVARAVILTSTQMSTYSECKESLQKGWPSIFPTSTCPQLSFACSIVASFVANAFSMPLDVIKSRIQSMPVPEPGKAPLYNGLMDCAKKSIAAEGPLVLWSGFTPAFVKLLPYTFISLSLLEKITFFFTGKDAL